MNLKLGEIKICGDFIIIMLKLRKQILIVGYVLNFLKKFGLKYSLIDASFKIVADKKK